MAGEYLPPVVTELIGNADDLLRTIAVAKAAMQSLKDSAQDIKIKVGIAGIIGPTTGAITQINALKQALNGLDSQTIRIAADTRIQTDTTTAAVNRQTVAWGFWGLTAMQWFKLIHNTVTIFGSQIISDTIGILAFGAAAAQTLRPVFSNISNLGAAWNTYSNAQKLAAQNTYNFINGLQSHDLQVVSVYDNFLQIITSHTGLMGNATAQATQAFLIFGNEIRTALGSPEFQRFFGSHAIAQDLSQLGTTIVDLGGALVSLAHNFNFLGSWALSGIGAVLRAFTWLNNVNPTLARFALLTLTAAHAWQFLRNSVVGTFLATQIAGIANATTYLGGAIANFRKFGLIPTLGFITGLDAAGLALAGTLGAVGIALGVGIYFGNRNALASTDQLIAGFRQADQATGSNVAGYLRFASTMDYLSTHIQAAGNTNLEFLRNFRASGVGATSIAADFKNAGTQATNAATNLTYLMRTYNLTAVQAYQLAKALGLVSQLQSHTFTAQQRAAIAQYEQTVAQSNNVSTAMRFDMQQAANAALGLNSQIQGLANAFGLLLAPFANTIQATVTWKNDIVTLKTDVNNASGAVGYHTAAQRTAAAALATSLTDTINLSNATLASTHSYTQAASFITQEIGVLKGLGSQSALVKQAIADLEAQLAALRDKHITITTTFVTNGGVVPPTVGRRFGSAPQALAPTLTLSSNAAASNVTLTQPALSPEIHLYIDSREITKAVEVRAVRRQKRSGFNGQQRILR